MSSRAPLLRLASASVLAFLAQACAGGQDVILEAKDVQFLKVEGIPPIDPKTLKISGLAFKSSMSVRDITEERKGSILVVIVHIGLARPGKSGSFTYDVMLPDSVKEVRFGTSPTPIWQRAAGSH